jgi:hypothetical protein
MTSVAVAVQVYSLTHSSLAVGLTGLFVAVPLITMGLLGGSFADAVDRRKLVLVTSSLVAVVSLVFAVQALLDLRQLWLLYSLIALESCLFALDAPARWTFVPRLLPSAQIPAAAAFSGPLSHVRRQGFAVLVAIAVWGAAIAGFGLMSLLWAAVVLLAVAGAADVVNGVFRSTILQVNTPDALRGRVSGVGFVVGAGGPRLGDVEAGAVAAITSPVISAVSGGLACVLGVVLLGLAVPALARYDAHAAPRYPKV